MSKIEFTKTYAGKDLESVFFRPMLSGPGAKELGITVMYNAPVPTTLHFWKRTGDILHPFVEAGWNGSVPAERYQKTIRLGRVKAEASYSAADYFNLVYELISARGDVNFEDMGGTELERAETELFKTAVAESLRATMWLGDVSRDNELYASFNGFIPTIATEIKDDEECEIPNFTYTAAQNKDEYVLRTLWDNASEELRALKSDGNLVYLVTSDIYANYEDSLDSAVLESAYLARQQGRESLSYRGIPVVDVKVGQYLPDCSDVPSSFALLTDRRNLALAVNTNDFPGSEVRMWYNPDLMENRQRAVFMAGCDYLLPELMVFAQQVAAPATKQ